METVTGIIFAGPPPVFIMTAALIGSLIPVVLLLLNPQTVSSVRLKAGYYFVSTIFFGLWLATALAFYFRITHSAALQSGCKDIVDAEWFALDCLIVLMCLVVFIAFLPLIAPPSRSLGKGPNGLVLANNNNYQVQSAPPHPPGGAEAWSNNEKKPDVEFYKGKN